MGSDNASMNVLQPAAVYPLRFWRIDGITALDSQEIFITLKENGFLDDENYLIKHPHRGAMGADWHNYLDSKYDNFYGPIESQLMISWTEHQFFSDFNGKIIRFFDNHRLEVIK